MLPMTLVWLLPEHAVQVPKHPCRHFILEVESCLLQKVEIDKQTPTLKAQKGGLMEVSVGFAAWPKSPSCSCYAGHSCCFMLL